MNSKLKYAIGFLLVAGIIFAVLLQSVFWSWPVPDGDVTLSRGQAFRAQVGGLIYDYGMAPFKPTRSLLGQYNLVLAALVWAGGIYSALLFFGRRLAVRTQSQSK